MISPSRRASRRAALPRGKARPAARRCRPRAALGRRSGPCRGTLAARGPPAHEPPPLSLPARVASMGSASSASYSARAGQPSTSACSVSSLGVHQSSQGERCRAGYSEHRASTGRLETAEYSGRRASSRARVGVLYYEYPGLHSPSGAQDLGREGERCSASGATSCGALCKPTMYGRTTALITLIAQIAARHSTELSGPRST